MDWRIGVESLQISEWFKYLSGSYTEVGKICQCIFTSEINCDGSLGKQLLGRRFRTEMLLLEEAVCLR